MKNFILIFTLVLTVSSNEWVPDNSLLQSEDVIELSQEVGEDGTDYIDYEYWHENIYENVTDSQDETFSERIDTLWDSFSSSWNHVFDSIRDTFYAIGNFHLTVEQLSSDFKDMTENNSLGGVNFNPIIATIRWMTGDLVFYEIYILIYIGFVFIAIKFVNTVFKAIFTAVNGFTNFGAKSAGKFVLFQWIGKWFSGI